MLINLNKNRYKNILYAVFSVQLTFCLYIYINVYYKHHSIKINILHCFVPVLNHESVILQGVLINLE